MDRITTKGEMVEQVDLRNVPHSGFDRSNHNYQSCKLGKIVPARIDGLYPGDRIKGRPQIVANFEPLAGPIMGSMVLKQESFYVPLYEVWRRSDHFFTQKDESLVVPSASQLDIYQAYVNKKLFTCINSSVLEDTAPAFSAIQSCYGTNTAMSVESYETCVDAFEIYFANIISNLEDYGELKHVLDILQPQIDRTKKMESILNDALTQLVTADLTTYKQTAYDLLIAFVDYWSDYYNYFLGASSLVDYLGFPCIDDCRKDWFLPRVTDYMIEGDYGDEDLTWVLSPHTIMSEIPLSFLPFRAYYLIWFWNYRDQLLEKDAYDCDTDAFTANEVTADQMVLFTLLRVRCWYKDTFTTALTNTGSGNLIVPSFNAFGSAETTFYDENGNLINTTDKSTAVSSGATICQVSLGGMTYKIPMNYLQTAQDSYNDSTNDSSNAFISLDLFDRISRLRRFLQKKLIVGYEVDDVVYSSFLVKMTNVRMRIPELLGRGRDVVEMNTIVNNTTTNEQIAGDKTATAWAQGSMSEINYFSEEWGFYMHLYSILPIQSYSGGMQRMWLKRDVYDFMWPEFATMGMDAVYNCELAAPNGLNISDEQALLVFGYQGRYYDLKSRQDEVHGRLRTDLNYMTFSRKFDKDNLPLLNYAFVHCWPPLDMFVTDDPDVDVVKCVDIYNGLAFERRLPVPSEFI